MPKTAWVLAASKAILDLLELHLAAPHVEIEHRLATDGADGRRFDPHIVTEALALLTGHGAIVTVSHATKGGTAPVPLYIVAELHLRRTAVGQAVRRKAMLYARLNRLTQTAGPAGELVVRHSLTTSGPHLTQMQPGYGEVSRYGSALKFPGPLDSGAYLMTMGSNGLPGQPTDVLIEVKNRRLVLYPTHKEPHQLLHKAALAQLAEPDRSVLPVLICRRAHYRLFSMARDLGLLIHQTHDQYVLPPKTATRHLVEQVRTELGLNDLVFLDISKPPRIVNFFDSTIPARSQGSAQRWKITAPLIRDFSAELRQEKAELTPVVRLDKIRQLRQLTETEFAKHDLPFEGNWSLPDLEDSLDDEEFGGYEDPWSHLDT